MTVGARKRSKMKILVALIALAILIQGCASDPPKVYPPAPVTAEYPVKLSWANLHNPVGVDRYSWLVPAVTSKSIFVAQRNGELLSLNLENGAPLWQQQTSYRFSAGPALHDEVLFAGTRKAELIAFSAKNGEVLWTQLLSSEILVPPLISGERIIVRSNDGKVYGLRVKDGRITWVYDRNVPALTLRGNSIPVVHDENVIIGFANGRLISLSIMDGKTNWETAITLPRGRTELERMVDIDGPLVMDNGIVYVAAYNGKVAAVSATTGSISWTREISSHLGATVLGDNLFLTDVSGKIWALNKDSGSTLWMQDKLQERASTRPIMINNQLIVGDALGELYWLSASDGRLLGHFPHNEPSKASGATWYIDEIDAAHFFPPRREDTALIFEPRYIDKKLVVTYQNGVLATVVIDN